MFTPVSRRSLLKWASLGVPASTLRMPSAAAFGAGRFLAGRNGTQADGAPADNIVSDIFPAHPPELVREMVTVAHFDLTRVKQLLAAHPSLARAGWDWGFGDWETPLGAASHMGNRAMAEYLISQGAPPSLFSAAMLGHLDAVKALLATAPGLQRLRGPHGITLLAHARMGGEGARAVLDFLQSLGDADAPEPAPFSEQEAATLVGTYMFGAGITQQVDVNTDLKLYVSSKMYTHPPQLNWTRKGAMTRPLFHVGERKFYPAGSPAVRIEFRKTNDGLLMNVTDGGVTLSALRKRKSNYNLQGSHAAPTLLQGRVCKCHGSQSSRNSVHTQGDCFAERNSHSDTFFACLTLTLDKHNCGRQLRGGDMFTSRVVRFVGVGILAISVAATPTFSQGKGKGHNKNSDEDHGNGKAKGRYKHDFDNHDRELITTYYSGRGSSLPPGLAKRGGNLPPGLEKHLEKNGTLPPGLQKKIQPCPVDLVRQLPPVEPGYARGVIGAHVVLYNRNTNVIVDIVKDVVH